MVTLVPIESDPVIPHAEYPAVVSRINPNQQKQYGMSVQVFFKIVEGQFTGCEASKWFSQRITPRTDLYTLLKTLDVAVPEQIGQTVDLDQMVSRPCVVTIEPSEVVGKNGGKITYNNVTAWRRRVMPAPGTSIAAAPAVAPTASPVPAAAPAAAVPPATGARPNF